MIAAGDVDGDARKGIVGAEMVVTDGVAFPRTAETFGTFAQAAEEAHDEGGSWTVLYFCLDG